MRQRSDDTGHVGALSVRSGYLGVWQRHRYGYYGEGAEGLRCNYCLRECTWLSQAECKFHYFYRYSFVMFFLLFVVDMAHDVNLGVAVFYPLTLFPF